MSQLTFKKLNIGWNADPNAPMPKIRVYGSEIEVTFLLNSFLYDVPENECGHLIFTNCARWRLGTPNDEGWYRGNCRYSRIAPEWGEFYELVGQDDTDPPEDWNNSEFEGSGNRHFLFYFRDQTFECFASNWIFKFSSKESDTPTTHVPPEVV